MAQAANQLTRIDDLNDLLRYLTEELGYEKYPALWEMQERFWDGQLLLTRQRHVEGKPYSPTDGKPYNREPVNPSFARSKLTLEFDSHDRVQVISRAAGFEWWDFRYLIAEGCDARTICWRRCPPASQPVPDVVKKDVPVRKPRRSASEKPKKTQRARLISLMEETNLEKSGLLPHEAREKIRPRFRKKYRKLKVPADRTIDRAYEKYAGVTNTSVE
jgi:hypothetical protein